MSALVRAKLLNSHLRSLLSTNKIHRRNMGIIAPYAAQHANSKGAGDSRPTALQIVSDQGLTGKLANKVFLVTGCSSGIGVETARALDATGAQVFITARDVVKGQEVLKDIEGSGGSGTVKLVEMDLSSLDSIKKAANQFLAMSNTLNILINNAGVMACAQSSTTDGFETQFGTNHIGHFLLFQLLKPVLLKSSTPEFPSRVISVSSTGHRHPGPDGIGPLDLNDLDFKKRGYEPWLSYGQSKVSNIYLANELERRYGSAGLHALSLHPGGIWTPLQRHQPQMESLKEDPTIQAYMKSPEQGAATTVWAALSKELEGKGGIYLEDCQEAIPADQSKQSDPLRPGFAPWAYNPDLEKQLWLDSLKLIGIQDDQ